MFKNVAFLMLILFPCCIYVYMYICCLLITWCLSHTLVQSSSSSFSSSSSSKSSHSLPLSCISPSVRVDEKGPQTHGCGVTMVAASASELPRESEVTDVELIVRYSSSIGVRETVSGMHFVFESSSLLLLNMRLENKNIAVLGFFSICFTRCPLTTLLFTPDI